MRRVSVSRFPLTAADESDYRVLFSTGRVRPAIESHALEAFLELRVDGIVLVGSRLPRAAIEAAARTVPLVAVGRRLRSSVVDTINNHEQAGARLAVDHLAGLGHERIVHIDGGRGAGSAPRRSGYRAAMGRHGLKDHVRVVGGDLTELSGVRAVASLVRSNDLPTAIFAANDLSAAGALDRDRRSSLIADVAFAAGTLATASGLYLLVRRSPQSSVTAQVAVGPRGGGMELAGRF